VKVEYLKNPDDKIRYAVVGLGFIAQAEVLPAFTHARENSRLTALVSDDPTKLEELGRKYRVKNLYSYKQFDDCLHSGEIDAVYIALPNHLHCEYAVRAAEAGIHVLCEKPMALDEEECLRMIETAEQSRVRLMIAYRLHFEEANLKAVDIVQSGLIGEPRFFQSTFSMQVKQGDIRLRRETGGGTLYDIGIYCINAARYLFRDEPHEGLAFSVSGSDPRFTEVDETTSAVLRFGDDRLASFTVGFGSADVSEYRIVGAEGELRVASAYEHASKITHYLTLQGETKKTVFAHRDQFAPELLYFSKCLLEGRKPEPCGMEGLADVRIIKALYRSAVEGQSQLIPTLTRDDRPSLRQEIRRPAHATPKLIHAADPTG